jgi:hypothetical protein
LVQSRVALSGMGDWRNAVGPAGPKDALLGGVMPLDDRAAWLEDLVAPLLPPQDEASPLDDAPGEAGDHPCWHHPSSPQTLSGRQSTWLRHR